MVTACFCLLAMAVTALCSFSKTWVAREPPSHLTPFTKHVKGSQPLRGPRISSQPDRVLWPKDSLRRPSAAPKSSCTKAPSLLGSRAPLKVTETPMRVHTEASAVRVRSRSSRSAAWAPSSMPRRA